MGGRADARRRDGLIVLEGAVSVGAALEGGRRPVERILIRADKWDKSGQLRALARAVGTRAGVEDTAEAQDRVTFFRFDSPPVSSREIRTRVARGVPIDGLVPPAVADLIWDSALYRG